MQSELEFILIQLKNKRILPKILPNLTEAPANPAAESVVKDAIIKVKLAQIRDFVGAMTGAVADLYRENTKMHNFYKDCGLVPKPKFQFNDKVSFTTVILD